MKRLPDFFLPFLLIPMMAIAFFLPCRLDSAVLVPAPVSEVSEVTELRPSPGEASLEAFLSSLDSGDLEAAERILSDPGSGLTPDLKIGLRIALDSSRESQEIVSALSIEAERWETKLKADVARLKAEHQIALGEAVAEKAKSQQAAREERQAREEAESRLAERVQLDSLQIRNLIDELNQSVNQARDQFAKIDEALSSLPKSGLFEEISESVAMTESQESKEVTDTP